MAYQYIAVLCMFSSILFTILLLPIQPKITANFMTNSLNSEVLIAYF